MKVEDGTGTGFLANVDSEHRLHTLAIAVPRLADNVEREGEAYLFGLGKKTLTDTSEHPVAHVQIGSGGQHGHLHRLHVSWNGGSTSHNRVLAVRLYLEMDAPSANNVLKEPVNLNGGKANKANGTFNRWNGTGTGMTVASNGDEFATFLVRQGTSMICFEGAVVLPPNAKFGITAQGEEVGDLSLSLIGFFEAD